MNLAWSWCMIFFICCWIWFTNILLRILHLYSTRVLAYYFLLWWCLCLVLVSVWWWLHRKSLGVFTLLQSFGKVWQGSVLLCMSGRIHLWSHLVLDFVVESFYYYCYRFYFISSSDMRRVLNSDILFQMTSVYPRATVLEMWLQDRKHQYQLWTCENVTYLTHQSHNNTHGNLWSVFSQSCYSDTQ